MALFSRMIATSDLTAAALNSIAATSTARGPALPFPSWDGSPNSLPVFLANLENYKADPFFSSVISWTYTDPADVVVSRRICTDMYARLPPMHLQPFFNNPSFTNDGIKMLDAFLRTISPERPEDRLADLQELTSLDMTSQDTPQGYMSTVRGLDMRLGQVVMRDLMPLFAILGLDSGRYDGIINRFTGGNPTIVNADLGTLEYLLIQEDVRKRTLGVSSESRPSAN